MPVRLFHADENPVKIKEGGNKRGASWVRFIGRAMVQNTQPTLAQLIEQNYEALYRYAFRMSGSSTDAEDLTQNTYLIAQQRLEQLRDPSKARAWLFTILRNTFLKSVRGKKSKVVSLDDLPDPAQTEPTSGIAGITGLDSDELQQLLNQMPEDFRTVVMLFYFGEHSYRDIAEQLDIPQGTVMSRLSRGKTWLRNKLASRIPVGGS